MACELCTDPDGMACFPLYGLGSHVHLPEGGTVMLPNDPHTGFTPNPDEPGMGWHWCPACGDGREYAEQQLAAQPKWDA